MSGHGKKPTDRGGLTTWRRQREGLVRARKETDRPRRTHILETADGGACQDMERNRQTKAHSHPGDGRGMDLSGLGKKPTDRGSLTLWRRQRERDLSELGKKPTDRGGLTSWRRRREGLVRTQKETNRPRRTHNLERQGEGLVRTQKETDRPRRTHFLETAEGGTCQDSERN